jgi:hypothetical protein
MSLRLLLGLMALVSALMVAAVVYRKVLTPEVVTVGERRSLERLCGERCLDDGVASEQHDADALARVTRACIDRCVDDAVQARQPQARQPLAR